MEQSFIRKFGVLIVLAVAGAVAFGLLVREVTPLSSVDLKYSRKESLERSAAYLTGLGYHLDDYQQDGWFGFEGTTQLFLQSEKGMRSANDAIRSDSLPVHHWYVTWYDRTVPRSQTRETFSVWISPAGKILGFDHVIHDTVAKRAIGKDEAQHLAEGFLRKQGVNLDTYRLKTSSSTSQKNRVDHRFVWAEADTAAGKTIWLRVQGDEVGGFRESFDTGGDFQRIFSDIATTMTFYVTASFAVVFLLFFFVVILFLKKYHEGEVGTRTAIMIFIGLFAMAFVETTNEFPVIGTGTMIGDLNYFNVRIVMFVITVFIIQVFLSVMVFAAWSVGESSSRSTWPSKLTAVDSALFRKFFTVDVGEGIVRGYAWGLFLLGGYAGLLYVLEQYGGVRLFRNGIGGLPEAYVMSIQPLIGGITGAVTGEILYRLFLISYFKELLKKNWASLLISAVLWAATGITMWQLPFGQLQTVPMLVVLFVFGLVFGLLFMQYDVLTTMAANFVMTALGVAIPLFVSSGPSFVTARWIMLALLAVPLCIAIVGILRKERFVFTVETMPTHIQRISERVRMAKELEIARNVQMSLLPKTNPHAEGYDIAGICLPAQEVGGDYYDFVNLGGRRIGIAIGDVSGKGVPAAIYMTLTKGILQSHAEDNISPKSVLSKVNSLMYKTIERNSFVSMFYAILDVQRRTIRFARAGQCPVILAQHAGGQGSILTPKGMALGLEMGTVFDAVLEEQEIELRPGEVLVFYTDGFTEAMNEREEEFGEERLIAAVARHREKPAQDIIGALCDEIKDFIGSRPQHDDMTMVVLKVAGDA